MGIFELLILNVKKYKISTDFNTEFVSADTIIYVSTLNDSTGIRLNDTWKYFREVKRGAYAFFGSNSTLFYGKRWVTQVFIAKKPFAVRVYVQAVLNMNRQI